MSRTIRTTLALLAGLAAGCAMLRGELQTPRISLASVSIEELGLLEQRFELALRVQNPNDFPIHIRGLDYQLSLAGEPFAAGVSNRAARVPASGEALIRVPATANLLDTVQQLLEWQRSPPQSLAYALDGNIRLSGYDLRVPFEYSGSVPIRRGAE